MGDFRLEISATMMLYRSVHQPPTPRMLQKGETMGYERYSSFELFGVQGLGLRGVSLVAHDIKFKGRNPSGSHCKS